MMKIKVYHSAGPVAGGTTTFRGPDLKHRVESDGSLTVSGFVTATETGGAVFAPGQWQAFIRSRLIKDGAEDD